MTKNIRVAVVGRGEAGTLMADALLAAGINVIAFDPSTPVNAAAPLAGGIEEAVADAEVVLSLNSPVVAGRVAGQIAPLLKKGAVYADLNSGTPGMKKKLAALFPDGVFADVALLTPGAGPAAKISMAVAGTGAKAFIELLEPAGVSMEYISEVPGAAAARQVLRSILDRSLAAAVIDFLWAAESLGLKDWAHQEVLDEFNTSTAETARDYLTGTAQHLKRRQIEMMDVDETLRETGYESTMVAAIETNYSRILHGKRVPFSKLK